MLPLYLFIKYHLVMPSADEFKMHQLSDPFCTSLLHYLKSGDTLNLQKLHISVDSFFLKMVFFINPVFHLKMTLMNVSQLIVPQSLVDVILYHTHNSMLSGHPDRDRLQCSDLWPLVRKDNFSHCALLLMCCLLSICFSPEPLTDLPGCFSGHLFFLHHLSFSSYHMFFSHYPYFKNAIS